MAIQPADMTIVVCISTSCLSFSSPWKKLQIEYLLVDTCSFPREKLQFAVLLDLHFYRDIHINMCVGKYIVCGAHVQMYMYVLWILIIHQLLI